MADSLTPKTQRTETRPDDEHALGYVLVDTNTNEIDWDGVIHPDLPSAIREITHGVYSERYCMDEELERRPDKYFIPAYLVCAVVTSRIYDQRVITALQAEWEQRNA